MACHRARFSIDLSTYYVVSRTNLDSLLSMIFRIVSYSYIYQCIIQYSQCLVFVSIQYNTHKLLPFFTSRVFFCFRNCRQTAGRLVIYSPPKALQPSPSTLARTRHPLQTLQDWGSDDLRGSPARTPVGDKKVQGLNRSGPQRETDSVSLNLTVLALNMLQRFKFYTTFQKTPQKIMYTVKIIDKIIQINFIID